MATENEQHSLVPERADEPSTDFVLQEGFTSCWVRVDGVSVWIRRVMDGSDPQVSVELYKAGSESDDCISDAIAPAWPKAEWVVDSVLMMKTPTDAYCRVCHPDFDSEFWDISPDSDLWPQVLAIALSDLGEKRFIAIFGKDSLNLIAGR